MSEQWRLGCTYVSEDRLTHLTEIREDGAHGASRLVCTAPPEDARRIVEAVNERDALEAEVARFRMALEKIAKLSGRGTDGNIATLALDPACAWMIEAGWMSDPEIVEDEAFRAVLAAPAERRGEG